MILMLIGMISFIQTEITPNFPGNQPIIIDGSNNPSHPETEQKTIIDTFQVDAEPIVIILNGDAPPSVTQSSFQLSPKILGGERDIILTVLSGPSDRVITAGIARHQFYVAGTNDVDAVCTLQYDGVDGSENLSLSPGLGGIDLTDSHAIGFQVSATSDIGTSFTITVHSGNGASGSVRSTVIGDPMLTTDYVILFDSFSPLVNFTDIVAIELAVDANQNVDFHLDNFLTFGPVPSSSVGTSFSGSILPCDLNYYRIQTLTDLKPGDYVKISFNQTGDGDHPDALGALYISSSVYADLQAELATNVHIVDTLGELPGPNNFIYKCDVAHCDIEITSCQLEETTYYLAVAGNDAGVLLYSVDIHLSRTPVYQLFAQTPQPVLMDQRPDTPDDHTLYYRYLAIEIPVTVYSEGTYLVVNISNVESISGLEMRLNYGGLPESPFNTGVIGSIDFNSDGEQVDDCTFQYCVNTTRNSTDPYYENPVNTQPRMPCVCNSGLQNTCNLTVDPCHFQYGTWYIAILLPPYTIDTFDNANYTITAYVVQPTINALFRNATVKGTVEPESTTHYKLSVPASDVVTGQSHLIVQISNIRNGYVDLWVHQGMGGNNNLVGPEGCAPANATCHTRDSCNVIIEKCHFFPGTWYFAVSVGYNSTTNEFEVFEPDRLPITFTIRATWVEDPKPTKLFAGTPVFNAIGEALYDFYVLDIPPVVDTWLFIELYSRCEDTSVILSVLHGRLPGGECYARPDFYCITGSTNDDGTLTRQSCTFMIQTCELEPGPLYFSVYGHHTNYDVYGDTTFYQIPAQYTLYADFDTATALYSNISYTDSVVESQYQHYYIRADRVKQGSYLTVEVTNIKHGGPEAVEVFVNYNYLAGNCPCYDHFYNCTSATETNGVLDVNRTCCTIIVPPSDFRSGVWYIAVLGVQQDLSQYTTPIGYTLTVTLHDAPTFIPLFLGQEHSTTTPQFNKSLQYTHFKVAAVPIPLNDLVIDIVYNQNCNYLGKHNNLSDKLAMFVKADLPADELAFDYSCTANIESESYCTIVVPHCEWESNDYFISVKGDYNATFPARFTIHAHLDEIRDYQLTSGLSVHSKVTTGTYKHFFIESDGNQINHLLINLYTNQDQDVVSVYLNVNSRAGTAPCYTNIASCENERMCSWQINAIDIVQGRYYISVYGERQWYDTPVDFTLVAEFQKFAIDLQSGVPLINQILVEQVQYYRFSVDTQSLGDYLTIDIENVDYGLVSMYVNYGSAAGSCPGYLYTQTCSATSQGTEWCGLRIPSCELQLGNYFITIMCLENYSPCEDPHQKVGYTIEVNQITPLLLTPEVDVGRDTTNIMRGTLLNNRFAHYQFRYTSDDYNNGYHIFLEITRVRGGTLYVYYNKGSPSDSNIDCQLAQLCTNGLSSGGSCHWQIPFSLSKPTFQSEDLVEFQYITIEALSGSQEASYSILIWEQPPPDITANPTFTLDNATSSFIFPVNTELNITHLSQVEPYGGVQFIKLTDVPVHIEGDMLEVFFYRVINNIEESTAFNVYLYPEFPAGAHECCDNDPTTLASCTGAPTLRSVETTTQAGSDTEMVSHFCDLPHGIGNDMNGTDPFFGYRCTVRVWPCTYSRYCDVTSNWWLSVVPTEPTAGLPASPLSGLSYSVQWRVRNIKLDEQFLVDAISLNEFINNYSFTSAIPVYSNTTEDEGWLALYIDITPNSRISIQTNFIDGTSAVYIQPDHFASPPFGTCNSYYCISNDPNRPEDCAGTGRFISNECHPNKFSRYYITVRNLSGRNTVSFVSFRITMIDQPSIIQIPSHLSDISPFQASSNVFTPFDVTGVEGENYDTYVLAIDDSDIADHQSLLIDVTRPILDEGSLILYVRYGAQAGDYVGASSTFYTNAESCYTWLYSCDLPSSDSRCTLQIPHTELIQGYWYISLYNPDFLYNGTSDNLPDYNLVVTMQQPINLTLDVQDFVVNSTSISPPGSYINYKLNVTATDIGLDGPIEDDIIYSGDYYTTYLRFILSGFTGNITMYINYDDLAGEPSSLYNPFGFYQQSLSYIAFANCTDSVDCFIDFTPCELDGNSSFKLKSGVYYVSLLTNSDTSYSLAAYTLTDSYTALTSTTELGVGEREGTTNIYWTHTATPQELASQGDGEFYYRYTLNTAVDLLDKNYIIINFTISDSDLNQGTFLSLDVWRDDCTRFTCSLPLNGTWCVIDAVSLAPCTVKGGRFYFKVYNPNTTPFSIYVYQNETTVQTLLNEQIITEIVYPYEYQEYFFEAEDVLEGATLSVQVCADCGEVEAWIRPRLPTGPNCGIDHCIASGSSLVDLTEGANCCTMFLDTCQYEQQGYYIAVRGVSTNFPSNVNPNLYLPARYQIQATQTSIRVVNIAFVCPTPVTYFQPQTPQQFAVDLESANIGALLRFTLILPTQALTILNDTEFATLIISKNQTVGYTTQCENLQYFCQIPFDQNTLKCEVIIPAVNVSTGRYYIWANAPQNSIVIVERWDPYIPILQPNLLYTSTINAPNSIGNFFQGPFTPPTQYYRFDLEFDDDEFDSYDETFFVRVIIKNVRHGALSATLNSGYFPLTEISPSQPQPLFLDNLSCSNVTNRFNCYIDIELCDLFSLGSEKFGPNKNINTFWLTINGLQQLAELHSIQYSLVVQTNWIFTYFPVNHTVCNSIEVGEYNFHRLRPKSQEIPQHSILRFKLSEIDVANGEEVALFLNDNSVPTAGCYDLAYNSGQFTEQNDNVGLGVINFDWICPYSNLYLSVFGISSDDGTIDYRMNVTSIPVKVKELSNDSVYHNDDDDNDACGSKGDELYDFYIFNAVALNDNQTAFLRVSVDSDSPFTVYLNKGGFGFEECYIAKGTTDNGTVNLYDFCGYQDTSYFITVVAEGPYSIYTNVRDDAKELTLGEVHRDSLEHGEYQIYTVQVCKDWFAPDDRLVIEIADVQNGGVYGKIQLHSNPGFYQSPSGDGNCSIASADTFAQYTPGQTGFDFILINHSQLVAGTYHILIQAQPNRNDSTINENNQFVSFRLFPYLVDLEIDPIDVSPNSLITNQAVDFYTLSRNTQTYPPRTAYYQMTPQITDYSNSISFAQIRIQNVNGGLLYLRVSVGHLATPPSDYITGEIQSLTKEYTLGGNIQSGRRPFTYQRIIDDQNSTFYPECNGSADFCSIMHKDDVQHYRAQNSAVVWVPSCAFDLGSNLYISVEAIKQNFEDTPITYELYVEQLIDYEFLPPNTGFTNFMTNNNWEYHFYRSIEAGVQSARWRVVVSEGEGVLVTVRNNRCPLQATWTREVWCDANYFDSPYLCDIEIPTEASHPGNNAFFISVYGKNATYTIAYWRGLENCHLFTNDGLSEGLNFCSGIVDYPTWRWDDYAALDSEANCFFNELYQHFRIQPCWSGVTTDCNSTLRQFACYESFKACDANGFYVGTCRSSCDAVVYQCSDWFESVNLGHYNCSSSRYIADTTSTCTGSGAYAQFNDVTQLFFGGNPADILYDPSLNNETQAASSIAFSFILFLSLFALSLLRN